MRIVLNSTPLTSRWVLRQQRPYHHSFLPWEALEVALPTLLARCLQVRLPLPPAVQTILKLTLAPVSTPTVMVGCVHVSLNLCICVGTSSNLSFLPQMALSLLHSSHLEQQRQCGPSGKASSTHRTTQSSILMLRATSKTCSL